MSDISHIEGQIQIQDAAVRMTFEPFISAEAIQQKVRFIAQAIKHDYEGKQPLFLVVMNGAFVYAADLLRALDYNGEVQFVNIKSYIGTSSSGSVKIELPIDLSLEGKDIIIIEDIIDTGNTMVKLIPILNNHLPKSVAMTAIFVKPEALLHDLHIHYPGFSIGKEFVIGYGLDYNNVGRGLNALYQKI